MTVTILICLPIGIIGAFFPWTASLELLLIFKTLVPALGIGFCMFGFTHRISDSLKLLQLHRSNTPSSDTEMVLQRQRETYKKERDQENMLKEKKTH